MKKGFTLLEVLGVLIILGIIVLIAVPSITSNIDREKQQTKALVINNAVLAAKTYMETTDESNDKICFTFEFLKEHGYIRDIVDPTTGKNMTGTICATTVGGVYNYSYVLSTAVNNALTKDLSIGSAVYINPETKLVCTDYSLNNTLNLTKKGCLKWYIYKDNGNGTYQLILDHNTSTDVPWISADDYATANTDGTVCSRDACTDEGSITLDKQFAIDTKDWDTTLNERLITADEIAEITGANRSDTLKWDSKKTYAATPTDIETQSEWFWLDGGKNPNKQSYSKTDGWQKQYASATVKSDYSWLFDYTNKCTDYGCKNTYDTEAGVTGYWTSTPVTDSGASVWRVYCSGLMLYAYSFSGTGFGIRPVITFNYE